MEEVMDDGLFQNTLRIGKKAEAEATSYLETLGFIVKDISMEQMPDGHYSPFDLLVVKDNAVYVVDVKLKTDRNFWIHISSLLAYELYDTSATKLVLFSFGGLYRRDYSLKGGYRYIEVSMIRQLSFHKNSIFSFHIKFEDTREFI